jgi:hypothetical protein
LGTKARDLPAIRQQSNSWTPAIDDRKNEVIKIKFSTTVCGRCPRQLHCIRVSKEEQTAHHHYPTTGSSVLRCKLPNVGKRHQPSFGSQPYERALKPRYRKRVRAFGMRRSRSIGLAKTHLQRLGIAAAINVVRIVAWLMERNSLQQTFLLSRGSLMPLSGFPNNVRFVPDPILMCLYSGRSLWTGLFCYAT